MGCGFQQDAAQHILDLLQQQGPVLLRAGIDPILVKLIAAWNHFSWFQMPASSDRIRTLKGVKQGDVMGSTQFSLIHGHIL
eukprot:6043237-Prorocentrum_lima.AAC.1